MMRRVTVLLPIVLSLVALGCDELTKGFNKDFKTSYRKEFTTACTDSAVKGGAERDTVGPVCACMGEKLTTNYSTSELMKLSANPDGPKAEKILDKVAEECASESKLAPTATSQPTPKP